MLNDELEAALADHPDGKAALVVEDGPALRVVTYRALRQMVLALRSQLRSLGVEAGQVLPILASKSPEAIALAVATVLEGAAFCFLHERLDADYRSDLIRRMAPVGLVVDGQAAGRVTDPAGHLLPFAPIYLETPDSGRPEVLAGCPTLDAGYSHSGAGLPHRVGALCSQGAINVQFSSGSTGRPKAVLGSAPGLSHFVHTQIDAYGIGSDDRLLHILGLSNNLGLVQPFVTLISGAALHLTNRTTVAEIGALVRRSGITGLGGATPVWNSALAASPGRTLLLGETPTLRYITTGGTHTPWPLFERLRDRLGSRVSVFDVYGQAEIRQATSFEMTGPIEPEQMGSVGRAVPGATLFIARDQHTVAARGEVGEVGYAGPGAMVGYLEDPEATQTVTGSHAAFPGKVVVYTGDLGFLDRTGSLHLVGRAKTTLSTPDGPVWTATVEDALAHHPGVVESVVFALTDDPGNPGVGAVVLALPGTIVDEVRACATALLPPHMVPDRLTTVRSLPRTPNGKPAVAELRAKLLATT